ncbi:hypothetical protein KIN20_026207 [Parelaphostrongylus tenuis]|uniref:Glucosamine 6-phosphate N-acetyltransferase n=1 Tax=Parelaphostrongylus tenuis TaxID=148309 RepID=A0AAD5MWD8_PARTN|nr:hypothetical protein KIN20_026207 [Parelaphostrongylus tenuis]
MPMLPPVVTIGGQKEEVGAGDVSFEHIFDPRVLTDDITGDVPNGFVLRPLRIQDYDNGFLDLLAQLTTVGEVTRDAFEDQFKRMSKITPQAYYIVVIEDLSNKRVVGTATLVIEWKFIHDAGSRGRVEDVVVDKDVRGRKMGALLNRTLVALAKQIGVYKLSLECKDSLIPFYELHGYRKDIGNNFLVQRFDKDMLEVEIPRNNEESLGPRNP